MSHPHNVESWPFADPINTASFTTKHVLDGLHPIVEVYHDHDGDWQFLCGTTTEAADLKLVCMGCLLERDPSLAELADLPCGWSATRDGPQGDWAREAFEDSDDED